MIVHYKVLFLLFTDGVKNEVWNWVRKNCTYAPNSKKIPSQYVYRNPDFNISEVKDNKYLGVIHKQFRMVSPYLQNLLIRNDQTIFPPAPASSKVLADNTVVIKLEHAAII